MYGDYRLIPPGPDCDGCPYWEIIAPMRIEGGVPTVRCHYLDRVGDSCIDDGIKSCDVDLPREQYLGPPLPLERARLTCASGGLLAGTDVLVVGFLSKNRLWVFDGKQEIEVEAVALTVNHVGAVSSDDYVAWRAEQGMPPLRPFTLNWVGHQLPTRQPADHSPICAEGRLMPMRRSPNC
jgi:hypothetical protein